MGVRTSHRSEGGQLCWGRLSWSWSVAAGGPRVTRSLQRGETCVGTTEEWSQEADGAGPGLGAGLRGEPQTKRVGARWGRGRAGGGARRRESGTGRGGAVPGGGPGRGRGLRPRGCIAAAAGGLAGRRRARSGAASGLCDRGMAMAASPGPAGVGGAGAMPGSGPCSFGFDAGLEIKTRSVEQTLLPLVSQVKWLPARPLVSGGRGPRWRRRSRCGAGRTQPLPPFRARTTSARVSDLLSGSRTCLGGGGGGGGSRDPPRSGGEAEGLRAAGAAGRGSQGGPSARQQVRRRPGPRDPLRAEGGRPIPAPRRQRGTWPPPPTLADRDPPRCPLLTRCRLTLPSQLDPALLAAPAGGVPARPQLQRAPRAFVPSPPGACGSPGSHPPRPPCPCP